MRLGFFQGEAAGKALSRIILSDRRESKGNEYETWVFSRRSPAGKALSRIILSDRRESKGNEYR